MKIIVCLDDNNGLLFNKRRQSKDQIVITDIIKMINEKLHINAFSSDLFWDFNNKVLVSEKFLDEATKDKYCFVENVSVNYYIDRITEIIIYRWNRVYPTDYNFDIDIYYNKKEVDQMSSKREYEERIDNASSKSELIEILKDMKRDLGEHDPQVLELVKKLNL